ncbi:MAG: alpha/beta hydrolase family esterase [Burkholderiaceae bacterium]
MNINQQFLAQMQEAAQLLQTEGPMAATAAIQRALNGGATPSSPNAATSDPKQPEVLVDINPVSAANETPQPPRAGLSGLAQRLRARMARAAVQDVQDVQDRQPGTGEDQAPLKGKFLSLTASTPAGSRTYKLYIPSSYAPGGALVIMLHGCKQHPDDFAAGTGMNVLAEEHGCLVAYPAQSKNANGSNCWNWFQANDQRRERGEPAIIAAIARDILRDYKADPARVYVAGLSAGGAMAAILASQYPDLFAAAGIHSGLPTGAAHDVPSAFAAMKNGTVKAGGAAAIPLIVFHGDADKTVNPRNGQAVLAQRTAGRASNAEVEKGKAANGRGYTRAIHRDSTGKLLAEHWTVHGSGHAWSGGSRRGSYTDPQGPNASREMLRFFLEHRKNA